MGGHPGGDVASALATSVIHAWNGPERGESALESLTRLHGAAKQRVDERSHEESRLKEMGTTLTIAMVLRGLCYVSHIGDSRLYWLRGNRIARVTRDHTLAEEMVENGRLRREDADSHPMANVLTRCLGVCPDQHPDLLERGLRLAADDRLLLASDGLMKTVPTGELPGYVSGVDPRAAVDALMEAALAAGAPDNVTVIVVRVIECETPKPGADSLGWEDLDPQVSASS